MAHRFNPSHKHRLNSEERRKILPPEAILQKTGLKAGEKVVDIGAGIGYFAIPAARTVGLNGRLVAVDVSEEMLTELKSSVPDELRSVVETVAGEAENLPLESEQFDVAILANVLHESEQPDRVASEAVRVLKNGGRLAVVEWQKKETPHGPPLDERLSVEEIKEMLNKAGAEVTAVDELRFHVFISGRKQG